MKLDDSRRLAFVERLDGLEDRLAVRGGIDLRVLEGDLATFVNHKGPTCGRDAARQSFLFAFNQLFD